MPTTSSIPASGMDTVSPLFSLEDPSMALQCKIATFIHIGATSVLIWDILNNFAAEYRLLFRCKARLPSFIYLCARLALMTYMIGRSVFLTTPIPQCQNFLTFLNVALVINVSAITALFTLRLCAVYNMGKLISIICGLLWLGGIGLAIKFVHSFRAKRIGESGFCREIFKDSFLAPLLAGLLIDDCLIFILVTYRVYKVYLESGAPICRRLNTFCFGTSLPLLTKALHQDSQIYCLVTVISKAVSVFFAFNFDGPLQMLFVAHMVIANILCGKIYRKIRMSPNVHIQQTQTADLQSMELPVASANMKNVTASMPVFFHDPVSSIPQPNGRVYPPSRIHNYQKHVLDSNSALEEDITEGPESASPLSRAI